MLFNNFHCIIKKKTPEKRNFNDRKINKKNQKKTQKVGSRTEPGKYLKKKDKARPQNC